MSIWDDIGGAIGSFAGDLFGGGGDVLSAIGGGLGSIGSAVGQGLGDAASFLGQGAADVGSAIGTGVSDAAGAVQGAATNAGQGISDLFTGTPSVATGLAGDTSGGVAGAIPGLGADTGAALPIGSQDVSNYTSNFSPSSGMPTSLDAPGQQANPALQNLLNDPNSVSENINNVISPYGAPVGGALAGSSIPANDVYDSAPGVVAPSAGTGAASAPGVVGQASNYVSDLYKNSLAADIYGAGKNAIPGGDTLKGLAGIGSLGSLAYQALSPPQTAAQKAAAITATPLGQQQLTNAQNLGTASQALLAPSTTGVLPAGLQSGIDAQTAAAKQAIKGKYASLGMSGSSSEMTDLAAADAQAQTQKATIAQQMAQTGIAAAGGSSTDYAALSKQILAEDQAFTNALAGLSGTLQGAKPSSAATP